MWKIHASHHGQCFDLPPAKPITGTAREHSHSCAVHCSCLEAQGITEDHGGGEPLAAYSVLDEPERG